MVKIKGYKEFTESLYPQANEALVQTTQGGTGPQIETSTLPFKELKQKLYKDGWKSYIQFSSSKLKNANPKDIQMMHFKPAVRPNGWIGNKETNQVKKEMDDFLAKNNIPIENSYRVYKEDHHDYILVFVK